MDRDDSSALMNYGKDINLEINEKFILSQLAE